MTLVSSDPAWWPLLHWDRLLSYFIVASSTAVLYDWALTFGQEFEMIWRKRWSLVTFLYISVRYIGIPYSAMIILWYLPSVSMTEGCTVIYFVKLWIPVVVNSILAVIMIIRIFAMYQRSKMMLTFLIVLFLACLITTGVLMVIGNIHASGEEFVFSGIGYCSVVIEADDMRLNDENWTPSVVWEVLTLSLAVWLLLKHFRGLRLLPTVPTIGEVLIKSHVLYFVSIATVSFFNLGSVSPKLMNSSCVGTGIYVGLSQIAQLLQMFVLGPRLILSVREYHAKLLTYSDDGISMTFQERGYVSTGGDV